MSLIFLIVIALIVFFIVYTLLEKKSINRHKKNQNYQAKSQKVVHVAVGQDSGPVGTG